MFDKFFQQRRYENSHFNFTNLFMWRKPYNILWTEVENTLCIKASYGSKNFIIPPFGCKDEAVLRSVDLLRDYFCQKNEPLTIRGVTADIADMLQKMRPGQYLAEDDRDDYDYVYSANELIELKGRKYHSKKNHVNAFKRTYLSYEYKKLSKELSHDLVEQCILTEEEWYEKRNLEQEDKMLLFEKEAIIDALQNFDYFGLKGGTILINGKVEAFTFGEMLNSDTAVIHVEKGNPEIRGIYSLINWEFCRNAWSQLKYINREEDMGIEGLRKSKESYCPVKMIEKRIMTSIQS